MSRERELLAALVDMLERSNTAHLNYSIMGGEVVYANDLINVANELLEQPESNQWQPIEVIPHFKFVQAYCEKYHEGPGKEKDGVMVVCYRPATETRAAEFADDFGIVVNWEFSHWKKLPEPPKGIKPKA